MHLVEDEGLADVAPVADGPQVVDKHQEQQHKGYAGKCINCIDQKYHDQAAEDAQSTGVPCKETERGSKYKKKEINKNERTCMKMFHFGFTCANKI